MQNNLPHLTEPFFSCEQEAAHGISGGNCLVFVMDLAELVGRSSGLVQDGSPLQGKTPAATDWVTTWTLQTCW